MNKAEHDDFEHELVAIRNAGIPEAAILQQVETLCRSVTFENQGNPKKLLRYLVEQAIAGNVPRASEISRVVFSSPPDSPLVRQEARKLRNLLALHYETAKEGEIRLGIPPKQYGVFAPKLATATAQFPTPPARSVARILEPAQDAQVHQRVAVRGRIDVLHPDLRPWLIVETPVGDHYPQCWVSRGAPEWEHEVRIGLAQWGADEGAVYVIHLVAVSIEGDTAFYTYMKSGRDGFPPLLPADCLLLDKKRVTRRDIRA
jgi:hypothetical protein